MHSRMQPSWPTDSTTWRIWRSRALPPCSKTITTNGSNWQKPWLSRAITPLASSEARYTFCAQVFLFVLASKQKKVGTSHSSLPCIFRYISRRGQIGSSGGSCSILSQNHSIKEPTQNDASTDLKLPSYPSFPTWALEKSFLKSRPGDTWRNRNRSSKYSLFESGWRRREEKWRNNKKALIFLGECFVHESLLPFFYPTFPPFVIPCASFKSPSRQESTNQNR